MPSDRFRIQRWRGSGSEVVTLKNPKRLTSANMKLTGVLVFDLPAIHSCKNSKLCRRNCYAIKAQRMYPHVWRFRFLNYVLAKTRAKLLEDLIRTQLSRARKSVVRLHSSGDFFGQRYIDMWTRIISDFQGVSFYGYTKVLELFDFREIRAQPNVNIINSFIDGKLNFGPRDYVEQLVRENGAFICPCTMGEDVKCNAGCDYCLTGRRPVFVKH